jgi:hypothetical protein
MLLGDDVILKSNFKIIFMDSLGKVYCKQRSDLEDFLGYRGTIIDEKSIAYLVVFYFVPKATDQRIYWIEKYLLRKPNFKENIQHIINKITKAYLKPVKN